MAKQCRDNELVLEVEVGVFGGAEDGDSSSRSGVATQLHGASSPDSSQKKLYTTPADMLKVHETMRQVEGAELMLAPAFGNVHGFYKPGEVLLKPAILKEGQDAVTAKHGEAARFRLVFHGGSGSTIEEIHESIDYGVVKFNIHTDTQYAFTRAVAGHMMRNYDGVLRIDGEVGRKPDYLASTWLAEGRKGMARRVVQACQELKSAGKAMR
jgi:fructose-bisphosphate aldolase class II